MTALAPAPVASDAPLRPGMRVGGRYRIEVLIIESGSATAWCAVDEVLARQVVIRRLPRGVPLAADALAAVRLAAGLTDPRLARIYDADDGDQIPYVVSECAAGHPLDDLILTAGVPDPAIASLVVSEAAEALAVAHQAGAPHLCLTPRSVLWGRYGVRITGLGVDAALRGVTSVTPGETDTLALGQILYALLTGYWPGSQPTALPAAPRRRGRLYAPRQVRAGVPSALNAIACGTLMPQLSPSGAPCTSPAQLAAALRAARRPRDVMRDPIVTDFARAA